MICCSTPSSAEGQARRGLVLAGIMRLKQVCNHPAHFLKDRSRLHGRSGKLDRVEELLEELLAAGDKALCFTQFTEWGEQLAPYLDRRFGVPVLWLHGGYHAQAARRAGIGVPVDHRAGALPAVVEGGWYRPQPDGGVARGAPRSMVEPRGGGSGHRSGVPHRPAAQRTGAQARQHWHRGGADRRDDQRQARPRRQGRRRR